MKLFRRRADAEGIDGADVCLVLEGTYPFVAGGVSSWVNQIIKQMPDVSFSILHISPTSGFYKGHAYELPDNVLGVQEVYLHEAVSLSGSFDAIFKRKSVATFARFLEQVRSEDTSGFEKLVAAFQTPAVREANSASLLVHRLNWPGLVEGFRAEATDESFLNYFWNAYYAHQPLVNVLTARMPRARVYHTISTGYAGVLAAAASVHHRRPLLLTEHGIYTKERRIEIHAAEWIKDRVHEDLVVESEAPFFRRFWNRHFQTMSRICYEQSDEIFTLYTGNVREQIKDGAEPKKIRIIPNGISLSRFAEPAERFENRPKNKRFTIGFVGRVCPIKDVRTFVAAMRVVKDKVPDVLVRILGPMEEDPEYADECKRLAKALDLEDNVRFEGRVAVHEEMPKLDVLVLTSISEAQPLVILEGGAVGLPMVATDVGSCQELLNGRTPEDRALGVGGLITPIASPGETGRAVLELWADEGMRLQMGKSLQERVRRFYDQQDMICAYRDIYQAHTQAELPMRERCGTVEGQIFDEAVGEVASEIAADEVNARAADTARYEAMRELEQLVLESVFARAAAAKPVEGEPGTRPSAEASPAFDQVRRAEQYYCDDLAALDRERRAAFDSVRFAEQLDVEARRYGADLAIDVCRRMEQEFCEAWSPALDQERGLRAGPPEADELDASLESMRERIEGDRLDVDELLRFEESLANGSVAELVDEARELALDAAPSLLAEPFGGDSDELFHDEDFELVDELFDSFDAVDVFDTGELDGEHSDGAGGAD